MLSYVVCPDVFFPSLWFHACILISNECICLWLLGWYSPFDFFIPSMVHALGLHLFYSKRSNKYKDKDEGGGMDIPPNTMESDLVTTLLQDRVAISGDDAFGGTPRRRSKRQVATVATTSMKSMFQQERGRCKSRVAQAPKRQAVISPEARESNNPDPDYMPGSESECEHDDLRELWDELQ